MKEKLGKDYHKFITLRVLAEVANSVGAVSLTRVLTRELAKMAGYTVTTAGEGENTCWHCRHFITESVADSRGDCWLLGRTTHAQARCRLLEAVSGKPVGGGEVSIKDV